MLKSKKVQQEEISSIEMAFILHRDTMVPSKNILTNILNQVQETEKKQTIVTQIQSPYTWLALTQIVTVCLLMLAVYPTYRTMTDKKIANVQFRILDNQVSSFETKIDAEDQRNLLLNYTETDL